MNRRIFLKQAGLLTAAASIIPATAWSGNAGTMPNDNIQLGMIGVGKRGGGLLRSFLNSPGNRIVAVCDVDDNKLQRAVSGVNDFYDQKSGTSNSDCSAYRDFREVLARKDIDAVVIATPDHWHAIPVIMAAEAGKDIYGEKPLSLTLAEGRAMTNAVRRFDRVFQAGSQQRSDSKFRHACELVRNGYIGDIVKVNISIRTGFYPFPAVCELGPEQKLPELDWEMWQGPAPRRPYNAILAPPISFDGYPAWRNYRDYSGGGMTDWGAHHFDIAQWGLGMDTSGPVEAMPPSRDRKLLTYRYANGVIMETDFESNYILFTGTDGWVQVNRDYIRASSPSLLDVKIGPNEINLYNSKDHIGDWFSAIRKRSTPICDVETAHRSVSVCHLGNLSVQLDRTLHWDPEKEVFINDEQANRMRDRAKNSPWLL